MNLRMLNKYFTKITFTGIRSFLALSAGRCSAVSFGAHLTGLGDGRHQVFIICVPPAPPADLRLAAAGDHCPVLLVPEIQGYSISKQKERSKKGKRSCVNVCQ